MVQTYGCGIVVSQDHHQALQQIAGTPRPGSAEYAGLLRGVEAFRADHTVAAIKPVLAGELLNATG